MNPQKKQQMLALVLLTISSVFIFMIINKNIQEESKETQQTSSSGYTKETTVSLSTTSSEKIEKKLSIEEQLDQILNNMTLDEKIGQVFLARVPEKNVLEDIKKYHLGGYLLFGRDVSNETETTLKEKIAKFQQQSDIPLLIASDEEGGTVTRISNNPKVVSNKFKSPQELNSEGGREAIFKDIENKAKIFKNLGIHTGLFPIADVSTDPESFIYDRTIGLDTKGTSNYVSDNVTKLSQEKIGSTLKHFPGYGDNKDSHVEIVRDTRSLNEIEKYSLPPFIEGVKQGADSILVSHNIVEAYDSEVPASISLKVHEVIRKHLNFNGVVMTDDMDMAGLADFINQDQAALRALQAGNDLILSSTYGVQTPVIKNAILKGEYKEEQLNQSVLRILKWKHKLGIIKLEE